MEGNDSKAERMNLRQMFEYVYYKIYKSVDTGPSWISTALRTQLMLAMVECLFICSFIVYYNVLTDGNFVLSGKGASWVTIGMGVSITLINYFSFEHAEKWKAVVERYDAWPKQKNRRGTLIVWSVIIFIFVNIFFAFYLMNR